MIAAGRERVANARAIAVFDCGADAGRALDAIRERIDGIRIKARPRVLARLTAIAENAGVLIVAGPMRALDLLGSDDPLDACRRWLRPDRAPARRAPTRRPGTIKTVARIKAP